MIFYTILCYSIFLFRELPTLHALFLLHIVNRYS